MSEESLGIIRKNDYKPELEIEVALHTSRVEAMKPFRVEKKISHTILPEFSKNEWRDKLDWELEEIRRCKEGHTVGGTFLPGRFYYFMNHTFIRDKDLGKIRPMFRANQLEWAIFKDKLSKKSGSGAVMIKRRQWGASVDMAADNIYDCQFNHEFEIGMNSKGERDSQAFFQKHKYIHRNQSSFLRSYVHIDKRDAMVFGRWIEKEKKWKGTQSSIISVAPTPVAHAGNQYKKLVMDEVGETDCLPILANAEDCLMKNGVRIGVIYAFGTMGDTGTVGQGLMELWKNHKTYRLEQFPIWGYNCLIMDEFGNDMIEESIRSIIYERKRRENGSSLMYKKFIQKYPLTEADAFLDASGSGVGDPLLLGKQRIYLHENPPLKRVGFMRPKIGGGVDFVPDPLNGKIIIYEEPDPNRKNGYVANLDPAEDDDVEKTRDTSELSTSIVSKPFGLEAPKLCVEFCDRPKKLHEYYYQLALLLTWYNNNRVHIELNKGGWRALDWFEQNYPHLLGFTPASPTSIKGGMKMSRGVKMTPQTKIQLKGLGDAYVENYYNLIPSIKLIDQLGVVGAKGKDDDLAISFLWCLAILQGEKIPAGVGTAQDVKVPTVDYKKTDGRIQLVGPTGAPVHSGQQSIVKPKSAIFKGF
jgi:hypothetical protein